MPIWVWKLHGHQTQEGGIQRFAVLDAKEEAVGGATDAVVETSVIWDEVPMSTDRPGPMPAPRRVHRRSCFVT